MPANSIVETFKSFAKGESSSGVFVINKKSHASALNCTFTPNKYYVEKKWKINEIMAKKSDKRLLDIKIICDASYLNVLCLREKLTRI